LMALLAGLAVHEDPTSVGPIYVAEKAVDQDQVEKAALVRQVTRAAEEALRSARGKPAATKGWAPNSPTSDLAILSRIA